MSDPKSVGRWIFLFLRLGALAMLLALATACDLLQKPPEKPTVVISSPQNGAQFQAGQDILVQSISTNSNVTRIELQVDGNLVRADPVAAGQFNLSQTWKAAPGTHTLSVRVFSGNNVASDPAAIAIHGLTRGRPGHPTYCTAPSAHCASASANPVPRAAGDFQFHRISDLDHGRYLGDAELGSGVKCNRPLH